MQRVVPKLLPVVMSEDELDDEGRHLLHQTLLTLTNVAALTDWHKQFSDSLNRQVHSINPDVLIMYVVMYIMQDPGLDPRRLCQNQDAIPQTSRQSVHQRRYGSAFTRRQSK